MRAFIENYYTNFHKILGHIPIYTFNVEMTMIMMMKTMCNKKLGQIDKVEWANECGHF